MRQHRLQLRGPQGSRPLPFHLLTFFVLVAFAVLVVACGSRNTASSSAGREASLRQIASEYAQTGDLHKAQAALDRLNIANPGQLLLALAETDVSAGRTPQDVQLLASLAEALGAHSQKVVAYLAPPPTIAPTKDVGAAPQAETVLAATIEVPPPSPTSVPPTVAPTATVAPPTATAVPPTNSPTPEPQNPRVLASNDVNLRGGPGKGYSVVARLRSGQEAPIVGRNASGDWWQVDVKGIKQAWVAGTVVKVLGAIDTVEVAKNIPPVPTAAPRPTAAPQPTAAAAAPPPAAKPGAAYVVDTARLRRIGEGAQACNAGDHNIFVTVLDAGGAPLSGVRVYEIWTKQVKITGDKGPGKAEYDLYRNGGGQVQVVDENNNPLSELSRGLSNTFPDFDLMKAAGYCNCKPHPDDASCASDIANKTYMFAWGHYAYEVIFRRTY